VEPKRRRWPCFAPAVLLAFLAALPAPARADLYLLPSDGAPGGPSSVWDRLRIDGRDYAVVSAGPAETAELRGNAEAVPLPAAGPGEELFIVTAPRGRPLATIGTRGRIVIRDKRTALVFISQAGADELAGKGMEIQAVLPPPPPAPRRDPPAVRRGWDAGIQAIIDAVTEGGVWDAIGDLSGVNPVAIGGSPYPIQTRNSYQTVPIQQATQYCLEYFQGLGLDASFQSYTYGGQAWRNVEAVQTGTVSPGDIYVICGHLDDMPNAAVAPGADDNASGSAAVLLAAAVLSSRQFEGTIRYVLFTGEEQGMRGSYYYVARAVADGDDILGALNFDMIAYDGNDDGEIQVHCGTAVTASETIGDLLIDTVSSYGLGLVPTKITSGSTGSSDHVRFWNAGYPAILGIEDTWSDFNPFYHSASDLLSNCNGPYAAAFTQAAVGTAARLAVLLPPTPTPPYPPPSAIESGDYDGDGADDCAVFRPRSGIWLISGSAGIAFGGDEDVPVPADYTGDAIADVASFRPSSGLWTVRNITRMAYGASGDLPAPGDYDGDGTAAPGLFREEAGAWLLKDATRCYFGLAADVPVPGDWSGDGTRDIAVFRPTNGLWAVRFHTRLYFGLADDLPVPGDFDGTGWRAGIFRPSSGLWAVRGLTRFYAGVDGDRPVPADYDGDGIDDSGIFRPGEGVWHIRGLTRVSLGESGDLPVTR
jgi:hypothetical protein